MKVALFYDWLNQWGGAERVLLDILKIFPDAPIYTLVHNPAKTKWLPKKTKIITSFLQKLPNAINNPVYYTPLYPLALEQFDFSSFDIVISSTTTIGHCLLTPPKTLYLCYFHNINRHVYRQKHPLIQPFINVYKRHDQIYRQRPDYLLAGSKNAQNRLKKYYRRPSTLIYPGTNLNHFKPNQNQSQKYFLLVSRLVPHKKVDLAIHACHQLNLPLVIVGTGRQQKYLQKLKKQLRADNITFLHQVSSQKLLSLYQNCQALICPQHEDFGLTPIEAMACGKPVIALKKGGFLETVKPGTTGILFPQQNLNSLKQALQQFRPQNFNPQDCRHQAQKFSQKVFMLNFKKTIGRLCQTHQNTSS